MTFWVRFVETEEGYLVRRAYSHRMNIMKRVGTVMAVERTYYTIDPEGKLTCMKCKDSSCKRKSKFECIWKIGFPVEMPVCPKCGFVYVPEELALGKVLAVERALEDK